MKRLIFYIILFCTIWLSITNISARDAEDLKFASQVLFTRINYERQQLGLQELIWDSRLAELAEEHSKYMSTNDDYSHSNYDFPYYENIMSSVNADFIYTRWENSGGHYDNMFSPDIAEAGIGMAMELTRINIMGFKLIVNSGSGYCTFMAY